MQNRDIRPETAPATSTCVRVPCSGQRSGLMEVRWFEYVNVPHRGSALWPKTSISLLPPECEIGVCW